MKGVKLHNPQAERDLGLLFFEDHDHVHDLHAAATLLRESATAGDVPAMYSLGLLLAQNPALAKSKQEAIQFLNDSANAGIWKSSMVLGILARDGNEGPQDNNGAYYHFRVAVLQGREQVKKLLESDLRILSAKIGPDQTRATDSRAAEWYKHHQFVLEFVYKGDNRTRFPAYALAPPGNDEHVVQLVPTKPREEPEDGGFGATGGVEE